MSNLPYSATTTDLQTLFSDVGPVRSAFVVLEQGSRVSKGVGYVTFAIKADVQAAIEQACSEGITLDGRKLRVELAENKVNICAQGNRQVLNCAAEGKAGLAGQSGKHKTTSNSCETCTRSTYPSDCRDHWPAHLNKS